MCKELNGVSDHRCVCYHGVAVCKWLPLMVKTKGGFDSGMLCHFTGGLKIGCYRDKNRLELVFLFIISFIFFALVWERKAARHPFLLLSASWQDEEEENRRWRKSLHLLRDGCHASWHPGILRKQRGGERGVMLPNLQNARSGFLAPAEKAANTAAQPEPHVSIWGEAEVVCRGDQRRQTCQRGLPNVSAVWAWSCIRVELRGLHLLQQQPVAVLRDVWVPALYLCCQLR